MGRAVSDPYQRLITPPIPLQRYDKIFNYANFTCTSFAIIINIS